MRKIAGTMLMVVLVAAVSIMPAQAGFVDELSADIFIWGGAGGSHKSTSTDIPGRIIFTKTLFVPNEMLFDNHYCGTPGTCPPPGVQSQVINVSFWATGRIKVNIDNNQGQLMFGCFVNAGFGEVPCHNGVSRPVNHDCPSAADCTGWVSLLSSRKGKRVDDDEAGRDTVHHNWCIPRVNFNLGLDGAGGAYNTFVIRMAYRENTSTPGFGVINTAQVKITTATIESTELDGVTIDPCRDFNGL
jgi:hypothetical protein